MKVHAKRESECKGEAWGRGKVKGDLEGRYSKDDMKEGFEDENLNNRLRDATDMGVLDDGGKIRVIIKKVLSIRTR